MASHVTEGSPSLSPATPDRRRSTDRLAPSNRFFLAGCGAVLLLVLFAAVDLGGYTSLWDNAHRTVAFTLGFLLAVRGSVGSRGIQRYLALSVALGLGSWTLGQIAWNIQYASGFAAVPAPSDALFLFTVVPVAWGLWLLIHRSLGRAEKVAVAIDAVTTFLAIGTLFVVIFGAFAPGVDPLAGSLLLAYPILFLALAGAGSIAALATSQPPTVRGAYAVLAGFFLLGVAWIPWIANAPGVPVPGSVSNYLFSAGALLAGYGASTWRPAESRRARHERPGQRLLDALPLAAVGAAAAVLVLGRLSEGPYHALVDTGALLVTSFAVVRQSLLLAERSAIARREHLARGEAQEERDFTTAILETVGALVIVLDREGRIVRFNRACELLTGRAQEEVLGRRFWEVVPTDQVAGVERIAEDVRLGPFPNAYENEWHTSSGRRRLISWSNTAILDDAGDVVYAIGTGIDITDRRRADESMTALEDAGRLLARQGTTPRALDAVLAILAERFGYRYVSIYLWDGGVMILGAQRGYEDPITAFDERHGVVGRVIRTRESALVQDTLRDPDYVETDADVGSTICAPLLIEGELLGVLKVEQSREGAALDAGDLRLIETIADRVASAIAISRDRRELADRAAALQASEEQTRLVIESASDAYVGMDVDGLVTDWNRQAETIFGWSRDRVIGRSLAALIFAPARRAVQEAALLHAGIPDGGRAPERRMEFEAVHRDGRSFPVEITVWPVRTPRGYHFSAFIHDISVRKQLEDELRFQAFHDPLTGLANRALLSDRAAHALARRRSENETVCLLFLDLDDFKTINDSLGHATGDQLLVAAAARVTNALRPEDTAARLGGDEFGILIEEATESTAAEVATRILGALQAPFELQGKQTFVTGSVGIALAQDDAAGVDELIRNADMAMYMAKTKGKGRYEVFESGMHVAAVRRLEMRAELQVAVEENQFKLEYQPIVNLATGATLGFEALLRWDHPTRGTIPPAEFIPLAEESALILPIGRWVLREACRQARSWQLSGRSNARLTIAVNIAPRQLHHPTLVDEVARVLADTGLPPETLILELTEGTLMQDTEHTVETFRNLKALGVRLAIDDFGTGYSSLSYLRRFPIDIVKIDRSFVAVLHSGAQDTAVVRAIVKLGQTLGLETIAEGIERPEQVERLRTLGARYGQGFHFAKPMPLDDVPKLLAVTRQGTASGSS